MTGVRTSSPRDESLRGHHLRLWRRQHVQHSTPAGQDRTLRRGRVLQSSPYALVESPLGPALGWAAKLRIPFDRFRRAAECNCVRERHAPLAHHVVHPGTISEAAGGGRPFLVVVAVNPPHGPLHDAPDDKKTLDLDEAALPCRLPDATLDFEEHRDNHASIRGMDGDVGRVMDRLDELGVTETPILLDTSGHGAMPGVDGIAFGQKRHPNDEFARAPFPVRWLGHLPSDLALGAPASTTDAFLTLVSLAGLGNASLGESSDEVRTLPGTDLLDLLRAKLNASRPDSVFSGASVQQQQRRRPPRADPAGRRHGRLHLRRGREK